MKKSKKYDIVPWDFAAPKEVRDVIVRAHVPNMAEGSDPRYKNEYSYTSTTSYATGIEDMERLVDALEANDVSVSEIGRAGEPSGLPGGNYSVVTLEQIEDYYHTTLAISDFGRVVSRDIGWFQQDDSYDWINDELGLESKKGCCSVRR